MSHRLLLITCILLGVTAYGHAADESSDAAREAYRWAPFEPVERPDIPIPKDAAWARNAIDAFVAAEHDRRELRPRPDAPRHVLLRRVYLDLSGLPPTRDELRRFLADDSPGAYERVVDRLLASPRYAERWGRHWMDVWRYSDWAGWSGGKQIRDSQPHIWRWRDWIMESLAADKGYDRMVLEMLAADELAPDDTDALRATGYLVRNYKMLSREQWLRDTVDHTARAFLGVTMRCARCHEHRYDAISQEDYYRFRAIFEPHKVRIDRIPGQPDITKDGIARVYDADLDVATYLFDRGDDRKPVKDKPLTAAVPAVLGGPAFAVEPVGLPLTASVPDRRDFVIRETIVACEKAVAKAKTDLEAAGEKAKDGNAAARDKLALAELDVPLAEARYAALLATVAVEKLEQAGGKDTEPARWAELARAAATAQRQRAQREAPRAQLAAQQALAAAKGAHEAAQRKAAAKKSDTKLKAAADKAKAAITEAQKKLAVAEKQVAGADEEAQKPITTDYKPRELKRYPAKSTGRRLALARWITDPRNPLTARVAVNHIWLRHFGQAIVPTVFEFGKNGRPPSHPALLDWLAAEFMQPSGGARPWSMKHIHCLIVTSRTYRMASTSDAHSLAVDPDNRYLWRMNSRRMEAELVRDAVLYVAGQLDLASGGPDIDFHQGMKIKRRSMYFRHAAEKQMAFLKLFDAAAVTECYERKESIVPQQALALANSALTLDQSRRLARSLTRHRGAAPGVFVDAAFEQVLARPATDEERATCLAFLDDQTTRFRGSASRLAAAADTATAEPKPSLDPAVRARENLVHVLLNHNDFVTIR